jgi:hypothetical protein
MVPERVMNTIRRLATAILLQAQLGDAMPMSRRGQYIGALHEHPQLGPVTPDPLRWDAAPDFLTTTSMTATDNWSMHLRQRRHGRQHRLGRTGHDARTPEPWSDRD